MSTDTEFKRHVADRAQRAMIALLGSTKGRRAGARLALSFAQAASQSKDPSALYRCSGESIAACIATAAETSIYPGGPYPKAYLVPRGGQLQMEITHRGIAALAQRAGYTLRAIPVHIDDPLLRVEFGEVVEHESDPDVWPSTLDDIRGVYVVMRRIADGATMSRAWVPVSIIRQRAESRQAGPVWRQWPIEMAMKAAIKYCVARGMIVIDSTELDIALDAEPAVTAPAIEQSAPAPRRLTEDIGDGLDALRAAPRERVPVEVEAPAEVEQQQEAPDPRAAIKAEIETMESRLGPDAYRPIREARNMGDRPVSAWKHGTARLQTYLDDLRAAIDAQVDADERAAIADAGDNPILF